MLVLAIVGVVVPAGAQTEQTELALGDWFGGAQAWGQGAAVVNGSPLTWSGQFKSSFDFTVSESSVVGEFDFSTSGLFGAQAITMRYDTPQGSMLAEFNADAGSGGVISGTRSQVEFHSRPMGTVGTVHFSGPSGEVSFPIDGEPSAVTIFTTIISMTCDQVIGDWDPSIIAQIEEAGWDAQFKGNWLAWPRPPEDQQTELDNLIDGMEELFEEYANFDASLGSGSSYDPLSADWSQLYNLVARAVEMTNKLHNLSECDRQAVGAEVIQEWTTALASLVGDLIIVLADHVAIARDIGEQGSLAFEGLIAIIAAADAVGAYGAGSVVDPGLAFQVDEALADLTGSTVEAHLRTSRGELAPPDGSACNDFCKGQHYRWAAGGVVEAVTHGWTITVDGQSYSPAEAPGLLANPPGDS